MQANYRVLAIEWQKDTLTATVPLSQVLGEDVHRDLDADFIRLASEPCLVIALDLRKVQSIDGRFLPRLLRLWQALRDSDVGLRVCACGNLREVLRICRIDQLVEVADC